MSNAQLSFDALEAAPPRSVLPRYPIYVPTRGRHGTDRRFTIRALLEDGVPVRAVVEEDEAEAYEKLLPRDQILVLPFSGQGSSIPARNWIREHAEAEGHEAHWQLDDNISTFYRLWKGRRILCHGGVALRVCEDFADRFANVAIAGLNYDMFVTAQTPVPYRRNCHVYSCTLLFHRMPYRHRGRYNEDTDLCLQALVNGWTTLSLNAFTCKKTTTMKTSGGNTESLYEMGERGETASDTYGRFEMAQSLERTWPGLVRVTRKFGRYQHTVNWSGFDTPFRRDGVSVPVSDVDEYGLHLREREPVQSERVRQFLREYEEEVAGTPAPDPLWRGMPAFMPVGEPPRLAVTFPSPEERDRLVERLGVRVDKKFEGKAWSAWWPPRERDDYWNLRFEP